MAQIIYTETFSLHGAFSALLAQLRRDAATEGSREQYIDVRNDPTRPDAVSIRLVCESKPEPGGEGGQHDRT